MPSILLTFMFKPIVSVSPWAKTIKKNTNSTQNKSQTHRAEQYEVTSFLSTDCELSTETCSKNDYSLGPLSPSSMSIASQPGFQCDFFTSKSNFVDLLSHNILISVVLLSSKNIYFHNHLVNVIINNLFDKMSFRCRTSP